MFIARQKKEENIVEYLLYMWQIEDIVRSCNFKMDVIADNIVEKMAVGRTEKEEVKQWYREIIISMEKANILKKGHLEELNYIQYELSLLHNSLINVFQDREYLKLFSCAQANLTEIQKKGYGANQGDVDACLTGLYGFLLLKLQKKKISPETTEAVKTFSNLMSYLALKYKEMKKGNLSFPEIIRN